MASAWVRFLLGVVGVLDAVTGGWAVVDPGGFYDDYPGFGRHWVSTQGPYNEHLVTDAGAGFLAVGVVLIVAAMWGRRVAVQIAALALIVHSVPHFIFHLTNPDDDISTADRAIATWGLALEALIGLVGLMAGGRRTSGYR